MSRITRPSQRLLLVVLAALAMVVLTGTTVFAINTARNGRAVTAVRTVTSTDDSTFNVTNAASTPWVDVTGMSTTVAVPAGEKALLVVTFSAVTRCQLETEHDFGLAFCNIRVLVDGTPIAPGTVYFDSASVGDAGDVWEAHSMQWVSGFLTAGSHVVKVQAQALGFSVGDTARFDLHVKTLTVLRSKQ